jgi:hypothetical protein
MIIAIFQYIRHCKSIHKIIIITYILRFVNLNNILVIAKIVTISIIELILANSIY